jgi:flagellar biogenesis protein FliO
MTSTFDYLSWSWIATIKNSTAQVVGGTYYGYLVNIIIIFLFLGVLYIGGRFLAKSNIGKVSGRKMEIIERVSLGMDRYLLMFKVVDMVYIMMIHKNGSELIDKVPADQFESNEHDTETNNNQFSDILKKVSQLNRK